MTRFGLRQVVPTILLFSIFAAAPSTRTSHPRRIPAKRLQTPLATTSIQARSSGPSSTRCTPTTTSRGRQARAARAESLPKSPTTADVHDQAEKASTSPMIGVRRQAELVAEMSCIRQRGDQKMRSPWAFWSQAEFVGLDEQIDAARSPASSISTRNCQAWRSSTSTRSGSVSRIPTTCPTHWRTNRRNRRPRSDRKYGDRWPSDGVRGSGPVQTGAVITRTEDRAQVIPTTVDSWDFVPQDARPKLVAR